MAGLKTNPRRFLTSRRVLLLIGVVIIAAGIVPAWRQASFSYYLSSGRGALAKGDFEKSRVHLEKAAKLQENSGEAHYRLAVLNRRTGNYPEYRRHLKEAEKLGWQRADIYRQDLLLKVAVGRFHEVEKELQSLIAQDISDEGALEVYEALAMGYMGSQRINDAMKALNYWINWRTKDATPRLLRGQIYEEFNDPDSARKEYREILAIEPENGRARLALAQLLLKGGEVDEAQQILEKCLEYQFEEPGVYLGLAECEYRSTKIEAAEKWLKQVDAEGMPVEGRAKVKKLEADIAQYKGDHQRVVEILTSAVKEWPHDVGLHQTLAQSYTALGQTDLAEKHIQQSQLITKRAEQFAELERKVVNNPDDPELRYLAGDLLAVQGLMQDALVWWHSALRADPYHQPSYEALIKYYGELGEEEKAAAYRKAAEASVPYTFYRGWNVLQKAEPMSAILAAQQLSLINAYPAYRLYSAVLTAALWNKEGRYSEAFELVEPALSHIDLGVPARLVQAEALVGMQRPLEAVSTLKAIVEANANVIEAHRLLAVIYYDLGAVSEAEKHLLLVSALAPEDYRPTRLLGLMNKDYENFDRAILAYKESLKRKPDQPDREEVLLELAECMIRQRDYAGAQETLEQALPSAQRDSFLAEALLGLGQRQQAAEIAARVLEEEPDNSRALVISGEIHLFEQQDQQAAQRFQRAVELNPYDYEIRMKYALALERAGKEEESKQESAKADELKDLRYKFAELQREAMERVQDAPLRREIARLAATLGRPDLADVWIKAAETIEESGASPVPVESETAPQN